MITVADARRQIAAFTKTMSPVEVSLEELGDCVAAESIIADRPLPAMDRVTMDGIALSQDVWAQGLRKFRVVGFQKAGEPPLALSEPGDCIEIMTGAMLPSAATAVVRYEDLEMDGQQVLVKPDVTVTFYGNVHRRGSDAKQGAELIRPGTRLGAAEWAVAASVGKQRIRVYPKPRVAVLTSGDEVLPVQATPKDYEIRGSNAWAIKALLNRFGFAATRVIHAADDPKTLSSTVEELLADHDVLITTGGVSKGKHDYLPGVLADLKVKRIFHNVSQRPGKPLWFGASGDGKLVFGLPGNPVSVMVGMRTYVIPALMAMSGRLARKQYARLTERVSFKPDLTLFQPVQVESSHEAVLLARPVFHNTSGDFSGLVGTDGFIELPRGRDVFEAGEVYEFLPWNPS